MPICKYCGAEITGISRICSKCGRYNHVAPQKQNNTVVVNRFMSGPRRFAAHHAVIERIAADVAQACACSYSVSKVKGTTMRSEFTLVIFPGEVRFDTAYRHQFSNYGMANLNISDLADFRAYFRPIFTEKFRNALNNQPRSCYGFTVEDQYLANMYDAKWALKVTVWSTQSGLTAW